MQRLLLLYLMVSLCVVMAKEKADFIFPDWKKKHKLNSRTFESEAHNAYIDIYVNDLAKDAYVQEKALFPKGAIVYKPLYADPEGKECARLVVMVKMHKGYDPKYGDWWYGVYDESGKEMYYQGKIKSCIICHQEAKETDYMFSQSVNAEIKRGSRSLPPQLPR